ncbi:MAG: hypothetical protein CMJ76_08305 [Planctomycetaceae bacterium]|nr:hypothetical protein [Planctomycetaceae bacterium]|tara:strand:+ start:1094 stop:2347 length:1254 start_codon:yes stop_codon:yes gene_type:complete
MSNICNSRRNFLQATGVSLALPMLESVDGKANEANTPVAQRLVCVGTYLGFHQKSFYPQQNGFDYEASELLKPIDHLRKDFTVLSGLDHRAGNGHGNWSTFLAGQKNNKITLDQITAPRICKESRFESLQVSAGKVSRPMNFTKTGIALPMIERPSVLYKKLFSSPGDRQRLDYLLDSGQSALDSVKEQAQQLQRRVSKNDQQKLEEYFSALRDVEQRVAKQREHLASPVAKVDYAMPEYDPIAPTLMLECENVMYDLMALALQSDSSRVITMNIGGLGQVFTLDGRTLRAGYHALSHHGNDQDKIRDLVRVELEHIRSFARFLEQLKHKTDANNQPLLDSTLVLLGTGMGDSSRHSNRNLPTLVAGGGLRHGQHLAFDPKNDSALLGDLYITMMQQLGLEESTFSNARNNLNQHLL